MPETVFILGATGRFGAAAADAFAAAGWRVRRQVRPGRTAEGPGEAVPVDVLDHEALTAAAMGADVIVHALNPPYPDWATEVPRLTKAAIVAARRSGAAVLIPGNLYNYGARLPDRLTEATPEAADHEKARLRIEMEEAWRASGVPTIVLRAGDFIDTKAGDNWFEGQITKDVAKGRIMYPGPLDRVHAWAYLPDMARAATMLAEGRARLAPFEMVNFPGYALTGDELIALVERALGRSLKRRRPPWGLVRLMGLVSPLMREVGAMRYLWDRPHRVDGARLAALLPGFEATPPDQAVRSSLAGSGRGPLAPAG